MLIAGTIIQMYLAVRAGVGVYGIVKKKLENKLNSTKLNKKEVL